MSLIDELMATDKKGLFKSNDVCECYSTGFLPLDFSNGTIYKKYYRNEKTGEMEYLNIPILGIVAGTFSTFIGKSGSGKSTLAQAIGASIIRPFPNGVLMVIDCEKTCLKPRLLSITRFDENDNRLILNKENTKIEDVFEIIDEICEMKEKLGKSIQYEIPNSEKIYGKKAFIYEPTVLIIDSIYSFFSKAVDMGTLKGGYEGGKAAKDIAEFYNKSLDKMQKYNIIIFGINHIKKKIENGIYPTASQLQLLKPDEILPRGEAPVYMSQNVFRTTGSMAKSKVYTFDEYGFDGNLVELQIAKTKTTFIGAVIPLVFNSDIGFDPVYTLYEFAHKCKVIEGRNPFLYFTGYKDMRFSKKTFGRLYAEDKSFGDMVTSVLEPFLLDLVGTKTPTTEELEIAESEASSLIVA